MTIVERIKEVSRNKNLNLKSTATKAGLSENAIYKWNTQKPNADALKAVADVLGVSVDYLLGNTDEMHPNNLPNSELRNQLAHGAIDIAEVDDSERDELISANGQPISDSDWAIIKAVLAKYERHED
ncbi:helix-turn-helix domain-containing protein [Weissella viridescens]|uniref:helix-turn-helix domain-containing protein n=1 Tax=Weissella viridescens TaxID=1629 RepID=UPI003AF1FF0F